MIVFDKFLTHLEQHNTAYRPATRVLKGISTAITRTQLTEYVIYQLEEGCAVTSLFLEFNKAFDLPQRQSVTSKTEKFRKKGKEKEWFSSYLKIKTQLVEITSTKDKTETKTRSELIDKETEREGAL